MSNLSKDPDFIMVLIPYYAKIIAEDMPERIRGLRFSAVQEVQKYLWHYHKHGYMSKLLCAIAEKKCEFIMSAASKVDMEQIVRPKCPHYDGCRFVPDKFSVPEEELICWSETSLYGPLNEVGFKRYMELFRQLLPEESKQLPI